MTNRKDFIEGISVSKRLTLRRSWPRRRRLTAFPREKLTALRCCVNGDLMAGRGDHVRGLNLGGSLDKSCHRLQHFRIGVGVVSFSIGLAFPQTDCSHINSAGTSERDFVPETILSTKQGKDVLLKGSRVIGKHIGLQMNRDIACKHRQPPKVGVAKR